MRIGIPREVKDGESRVALTPHGVGLLSAEVVFEPGAGAGVGFSDSDYEKHGGRPGEAWECDVIVKVKELHPSEFKRPRGGQIVLGFDQFAARRDLLDAALESGAAFISYNTVGRQRGESPILAPMSAIAGRLAVQVGAWCLQKQNGGSGVLLSGFDDVPPGKVAILGAGNVGANALAAACGIGADVTLFSRSGRRFAPLRQKYPQAKLSDRLDEAALVDADLIIGGVFNAGARPPKIVTRAMLRAMRPGSALVDVGIDQGGIAETSRLTSHSSPIYVEEGLVHYCVPNLPAACPRTASVALERALLPYLQVLAKGEMNDDLRAGLRVSEGRLLQ
jgi:alanine dehydrogenase